MAAETGFQGVKMKCKYGDPIAERVQAVRDTAPHFSIVFDPNERFETIEQTIEVSQALDGFDDIVFESPVPQQRLDWYVELRGRIPQKIALHLTSITDLIPALRADAADYYNLLGPLKEFSEWGRLTRAADCPTWRGTGMDLERCRMDSLAG